MLLSIISSENKKYRLALIHVLTWLLYALLLFLVNRLTGHELGLHNTVIFLLPFVLLFYLFLEIFRLKQKFGGTIVLVLLALVFGVISALAQVFSYFFVPGIGLSFYTSTGSRQILRTGLMEMAQYGCFAYLYYYLDRKYRMDKELFLNLETGYRKQLETARLRNLDMHDEQEKLEAEFEFVRSQVYPHFILNMLQSIGAQAAGASATLAGRIDKLSRLVKYSMAGLEHLPCRVPLDMELEHLNVMLDVYQLNSAERISLITEGPVTGHMIPPLIYISLAEQAVRADTGLVEIRIRSAEREIDFTCRHKKQGSEMESVNFERALSSLSRRLDISFRNRYLLHVPADKEYYKIELVIFN